MSAAEAGALTPVVTPDGRHLGVRGRLWRRSYPSLPGERRRLLVRELKGARRAVKAALASSDAASLKDARARILGAKVALG